LLALSSIVRESGKLRWRRRSGSALTLVLGAVLGGSALAEDRVHLYMRVAESRETVRGQLPLVEVSGRVSRASREPIDVVIALDVPESVLLPAGRLAAWLVATPVRAAHGPPDHAVVVDVAPRARAARLSTSRG
jgi:hypothetical protein